MFSSFRDANQPTELYQYVDQTIIKFIFPSDINVKTIHFIRTLFSSITTKLEIAHDLDATIKFNSIKIMD